MKNKFKKILACILSSAMVFQFVPGRVSAADEPAVKPDGRANFAVVAGEITEFKKTSEKYDKAAENQYFDNEKIHIQGNSWYYSGTFQYSEVPTDGGIRFVFGTGVYNQTISSIYKASVVGRRELTVTVNISGEKIEKILWSDSVVVNREQITGLSFAQNQNYKWTIEVENESLSFWIDNTPIYQNVKLDNYGITELKSKFGIKPGNSTGTVKDIQIWDNVTTEEELQSSQGTKIQIEADKVNYLPYDEIEQYRKEGAYTYPTDVEGFVFAGWYEEANENKPLAQDVEKGPAYAKFVPEEVLSIKAQLQVGTDYATDKTFMRLVTTVDSLKYKNISFDITIAGRVNKKVESNKVSQTINYTADEKVNKEYVPTEFHDVSKYFYTCKIINIGNNYFDTTFEIVPSWTTFDGTEVSGVTRTITVSDGENRRWKEVQLGNGLGGSKLVQLSTTHDGEQMMSYIIEADVPETEEKKIIVIDGGIPSNTGDGTNQNNASYLEYILNKKYGGHVDAWYITHEHSDHYGALYSMLKDDKIGTGEGQISVDALYYNFPDGVVRSETAIGYLFLQKLASYEYLNDKIKEPQLGEVHTYGNVTLKVLSDPDVYYGQIYPNNDYGDPNNASLLLLLEFNNGVDIKNEKVLFLGDMGKLGEPYALKQVQQCGIDLNGVIVQMAHHGNGGVSKAFYDLIKPSICLWPNANWLMENYQYWASEASGRKEPGAGGFESPELLQFLIENGVTEHYFASNGIYEFK